MTDDAAFESLLAAPDHIRDNMILDPARTEMLRRRLGQSAFAELRQICEERHRLRTATHLGSQCAPNLIFIPGVMGSLLHGKSLPGVWWIDALRGRDKIDRLGLAEDGGDPNEEADQVVPFDLDFTYEAFLLAAIKTRGFSPVKHPYDWRKPLLGSTESLARRVQEVWSSSGNQPVHMVAHSMGGLLARATLMEYGHHIGKMLGGMVFLGTPHYGTPTIAYYLRRHLRGSWAMYLLGKYLSRKTFRSMWGPIGLLPAPVGAYPGARAGESHPCVNFDLYDARAWRLKLEKPEEEQLERILDYTARLHRRLLESHKRLDVRVRDRMAVIAGVGFETPFQVLIDADRSGGTKTKVVFSRNMNDVNRDGDGSVPVSSAILEGVKEVRYVRCEHRSLPNIPAVYDDVFRFLRGEPMLLSRDRIAALEGHLGYHSASASPYLEGTRSSRAEFCTANRWLIKEPSEEEYDWLERELSSGRLPEFEQARIL